jgi:hypothetical protein
MDRVSVKLISLAAKSGCNVTCNLDGVIWSFGPTFCSIRSEHYCSSISNSLSELDRVAGTLYGLGIGPGPIWALKMARHAIEHKAPSDRHLSEVTWPGYGMDTMFFRLLHGDMVHARAECRTEERQWWLDCDGQAHYC